MFMCICYVQGNQVSYSVIPYLVGWGVTCQLGEWLEEKVLGSFVYVFLILSMKVSYGVFFLGTE